MIDIKILRETPDVLREGIAKKKFECDLDAILSLDKERRYIISETEHLRSEQKKASSIMAELPKGSDEFRQKIAELKELSSRVKDLQTSQQTIQDAWNEAFLTIPNMPHESVPTGKNEAENEVFCKWGDFENFPKWAKPHYEIEWFARLVDLGRGSKVTGAGFPFFIGDMAKLIRALINFFLDEAGQAGYTEVSPPDLVNTASATATGQLPDKEGQMYRIENHDLYLIPTAEVPVTNYFRDEIIEFSELPLQRCAYSPCFRREAGSYGKDVRGLNRLHQFDKVELVKWVDSKNSFDELESLRKDAENLLKKLELPYRVLLMCSGDIGFPHAKQYDLEVYAAGQKRWLEVSSCSNFTDFQARRANIRYRDEKGKLRFVHTLNGSALALPRTVAAILENNLLENGLVRVPGVLRPWVGKDTIGFAS